MRRMPGAKAGISGDLHRALADHKAGRLQRAGQGYQAILRRVPKHPDARYLAGVLASQTGAFNEAIEHFRICLGVRDDHVEARLGLANALQGSGRTAEAVPCYEAVLEKHPEQLTALNNLAVAHLALKNPEAAARTCMRAISVAPDYVPARNNLGVASLGIHDYPAAEATFRRALCLKPDDDAAMKGLGDALLAGLAPRESARVFAWALTGCPGNERRLYALGMAKRDAGDREGALAAWQETRRLHPDHDRAHAQIALLHLASGDVEEANRAVFDQVRA